MARPTKYSDATVKLIIDGVRAGLTNKDAALVAGIDEDTLIRWTKRYGDFADQLVQAKANRSADWLAHLRRAGQKDWRAYAELLDRCAPDYRKTVAHEHSGTFDHLHRGKLDLSLLSDDHVSTLADIAEHLKEPHPEGSR